VAIDFRTAAFAIVLSIFIEEDRAVLIEEFRDVGIDTSILEPFIPDTYEKKRKFISIKKG
jgi:hypothetical protein